MLTVHLLGTGRASFGNHPLEGFPTQQPHLLLCYLLLFRNQPHPRERLAAVFWGDCTTATSRKYLRNTLWRLRQELELVGAVADRYIGIAGECVSFLTASPYWLDVEAFESPIETYRELSGCDLQPGQARELQDADALYTGDLLEAVYEDWCLCERERLRLLHMSALSKLMDYHSAHAAYEEGLACGNAILALDNTREGVHRRMMQLYWLAGDRCAALGQYHRCVQILREELGLAPMAQTRHIYEQIRADQRPAAPLHPANAVAAANDPPNAMQLRVSVALQRLSRLEDLVRELGSELATIEDLVAATAPPLSRA